MKGKVIGANMVDETSNVKIIALFSLSNRPIAAAPIKGEEPAVITIAIKVLSFTGKLDAMNHINSGENKSNHDTKNKSLGQFKTKFRKDEKSSLYMLNVKRHHTAGKRIGFDWAATGCNTRPKIKPKLIAIEALRPMPSHNFSIICYILYIWN
tara:strand:- start:118 stop:576 length:459 start_codon:yes stop_codon:yes gene_type:complete